MMTVWQLQSASNSLYAVNMNEMNPTFSATWTVPRGSYFVTGTDTGVGKTWVSAALMMMLARQQQASAYMKPVQTGCVERDGRRIAPDVDLVQEVSGFAPPGDLEDLICPYRFLLPASPHLAASQAGEFVQMQVILSAYRTLAMRYPHIIVEGAGGVLVPLNERETMLDLMRQLSLPVLVVGRPALGTLNHTFMTVNTLRSAGVDVCGMILVQTHPPDPDPNRAREEALIIHDNQQTLELWSGLPIMGRLPYQQCSDNPMVMRQWLQDLIAQSGSG